MWLHRDGASCGASHVLSNRWREMSDTVHSLSTSGLSPKKQIQCWSDALTDLCGQFEIDPLKASSLEAHVTYTTVSRLKLCQIEVSQHRIAHTVARAKVERASLRQDTFPDRRDLLFRAGRPPHRTEARRYRGLRRGLSAFDHQPGANPARCRHRAQGTAAGARLPSRADVCLQAVGAHRHRPDLARIRRMRRSTRRRSCRRTTPPSSPIR